jgi:hypothetical protein
MVHDPDFLDRRRQVLAVILVLLGLIACLGLFKITITSDTRVFFAKDNVHLVQLEAFERTYAQNNNVLFVVAAKSRTLMSPEHLASLRELTDATWQLPHSIRVDGLTNFTHMTSIGDEFVIGDLLPEGADITPTLLEEITRVASRDPLLVDRLISKDLRTSGINVNFSLPAEGSEAIDVINAAALDLAKSFEAQNPDLEVYVTGNVILMKAFSSAAMQDLAYLLPLALLVILTMLMITLRSLVETFALSGILAFSAAIATGLTGWVAHPLNTASVVAPLIIMTLAMASFIHVITGLHRHMRLGHAQNEAFRMALKENRLPVFMTSLTTIVGFLALNFADAPPFRDLGNFVIIGILINFIFTFTLLPAAFDHIKVTVRPSSNPVDRPKLARFIGANSLAVLVIGTALIIPASLSILRLDLDDDFIRYFDESFAYRTASDFTEDRLTGLNILEFNLDSGTPNGIFDPGYQTRVEAFTIWLRAQNKVANVTSITDYTKRLNRHLSDNGQAVIPDDRNLIAQYYLLMDMGLPEGRSLSEVINTDQSASRVTANLRHATSGDVRRMNEAAQDWLKTNAPDLTVPGISINVLFSHLSINNIRSMIKGTIVSFLIISLIIMIMLRSVRLGVLSLLANSIPALVGFGLWGLLVGTVNLGASVLVSMTLGIIVDDTIHFLVAWKRYHLGGDSPAEAGASTLRSVGPAMLITTIALIAGFCVLALSGFDVNRTLGTFTAIIIAVALAVDLLMLPAALALLYRRRVAE